MINYHIYNSSTYKWIKSELSIIKGIKLYSIFKVIEYLLLLSNKLGYDLDLQLLKIMDAKKIKHKILSFLICCIFSYFNYYIIILFYYCTWLMIFDDNKSFIPIYLKVNYIEFKQANKSFKSIHNFLSNDIHDRFINYFVLFIVFINCLLDKNIKKINKIVYFKRIFIYFIAELLSDYIKGIIIFKLSNSNSKNIKKFLKEEIIYYKKLTYKKKNNDESFNYLKNVDMYESYLNDIESANVLIMALNVNVFPFCTILLYFFLFTIDIYFAFKIMIILLLLGLKLINEKLIHYFILFNIKDNESILSKNKNRIKQL